MYAVYKHCNTHGRRKGGGKGHVTPPKALKGGVRGGNFGGVRGGKSLRLLSNLFSSFCNNVSLPII